GMFYAVACSEDASFIDLAQAEALQAGSQFSLVAADFVTACADWPQAVVPEELRQPVTAVIPTLLLSGNADPITPPQYAECPLYRGANTRTSVTEFIEDCLYLSLFHVSLNSDSLYPFIAPANGWQAV
ncbi:hypothetical protein DC030_14750, partial [Enterococcus faecalis]